MYKILRIIIGFVLRYSPSEKISEILLWPIYKRLFRNYKEKVEIKNNLFMTVYGDMADMVNKTLLFSSPYLELSWEPGTSRLVYSLAKNYNNALVAGSHIGYYPLLLSHSNPNLNISAFEPNPINFERLVSNVSDNKNIEVYNLALGDRDEIKTMHFEAGQSSLIDSHRNSNDKGEVNIKTLDSFNKKAIDFMILDAEGYELNILKGALQTIEKYHPDIIFEVNPSIGNTFNNIKEILSQENYRLFLIKDNYCHDLKVRESDFNLDKIIKPFTDQKIFNFVNIFATVKNI